MRPATHWGSFSKGPNWRNWLMVAENAMRNRGYQIFEPGSDGDAIVAGGNNDVFVFVTVAPNSERTLITVLATSTDTAIAEQARNDIRAEIQRTQQID